MESVFEMYGEAIITVFSIMMVLVTIQCCFPEIRAITEIFYNSILFR